MIRRMKRQTKKRHSVLGGRKLLLKRTVIRMIAERFAAKIAERVSALLAEGAL